MPPAKAKKLRRAAAAAAPPESSSAPHPVAAETTPAAATPESSPTPPPVVAETTPVAAPPESSPAPPPVVAATPPESAEASVTLAEDGGGNDKMAVEDLGEVEREEATVAEPVEEEPDEEEREEEDPDEEEEEEEEEEDPDAEEDPEEEEEDPEDVEEDPEDAEEEADEVEGDEEDTVVAAGSEKTVTVEGGDEEKAMVTVSKEGGGEVTGLESAVVEEPEEAANVDEGHEEAEEEEAEEDAMEEDATEVPGEGAALDDINELSEEEHEESGHEGTHGDNGEDGVACQLSVHSEVQNGELDSSLPTPGSVSVGNAKDLEIFLRGLPKDCAEEDITEVFSQFGEIESIKTIRKKKAYIGFVRYMSTEAAKKALAEFKEGAEVKGERVKVSASKGNNTLYLRNICKSWTKEQVRTSLRSIGVNGFDMSLPVDPETGGQNRGITFLKFASPDNAKAASQLLQQPDALITTVKSVKESAGTPTESSQEFAMQVKTVYLEHVPLSWDKGKVEECCKAYGVIQEVHILKKSKTRFSFVEFSSRKSALACVEGINSAKIGGEVKLAASLARPRRKIQLDKKSAKGGVMVNSGATSKDTNNSIKKKDQNREVVVKKDSPHKLRKGDVSKLTSHVDAKVPQSSNPSKGKRKAGKTENTAVNERLPKKARKNRDVLTKPSNRTSHGGYARVAYAGESSGNIKRPMGPRYVTGNQSYPIAGASSRSKPNARDLEPHAGYIPPTNRVRAPANHVPVTYVYDQLRSAPSTIHHIDGLPYAREIAAPPPAYGYTSNPQYQNGYAYTYLPPHRPSGSYHYPGTGAYSPRRRYY